jgi:hypothetical protein
MNTITSMLWLMFLKGIGVGMVTAFISAVVYQLLFKNQYPNAGMSLAGQRLHALYFFGGMGDRSFNNADAGLRRSTATIPVAPQRLASRLLFVA